ncbi:hypothetical protein [Zavarzinia compransoris]|uniref:Uncharacterized protein n=1 Tax=Zavarzinia compransoris TaxID=1264899 RepID=A0A317E639_9PROT|nr:hypothetical protein [Zavarzinia compransoris]PWR22082.1 hypothetical protein DKG75_08895 [Zavarzinia compransoris]TDP47175.1 hypothetical protein DES42_103346 [Zavarzinia compransoris]
MIRVPAVLALILCAALLLPRPAAAEGCLADGGAAADFVLIDGGSRLSPAAFAEVARLIAKVRGWEIEGCGPDLATPLGEVLPPDLIHRVNGLLTASFPDGPENNIPPDLLRTLHLGVPATPCLARVEAGIENRCPVAVTVQHCTEAACPADDGLWLLAGETAAVAGPVFACPTGTTAEALTRAGAGLAGYCRLPEGGMP